MKAMILAAGRGTRMGPVTERIPKPLLLAGGKSLIVWHLEKLAAAGMREVVVNIAHHGHIIENALGDGHRHGVSIQYSREGHALETAGGIAWALPLLGSDPFAVINADAFIDYDYDALCDHSMRPATLAHLIVVNNPPHHPAGDFCLADGHLDNGSDGRLTYTGVGIYRPQLFQDIAPGSIVALAPLLREAISGARVTGEFHSGYWLDAGNPERLEELDRYLRQRVL